MEAGFKRSLGSEAAVSRAGNGNGNGYEAVVRLLQEYNGQPL